MKDFEGFNEEDLMSEMSAGEMGEMPVTKGKKSMWGNFWGGWGDAFDFEEINKKEICTKTASVFEEIKKKKIFLEFENGEKVNLANVRGVCHLRMGLDNKHG